MAPPNTQKHLIIDGYNVIHAWPELKKALLDSGPDLARSQLADITRVIHDTENTRLTIVFDGSGRDIDIERPTPETTFSLLYSPKDLSADGLIQQLTANTPNKNLITVATADTALGRAITELGATTISPESLLEWVKACEKKLDQDIKETQKSVRKKWKQQDPWNNNPF